MAKLGRGSNDLLVDSSATWAASAAVNTLNSIAVEFFSRLEESEKFSVTVRNPSTVTALTVRLRNRENAMGGADRFPEAQTFTVPVNTPEGVSVLAEGWPLGAAGRIDLSNNTVLGAGQGFTAEVRVRRI